VSLGHGEKPKRSRCGEGKTGKGSSAGGGVHARR